MNPLASPATPVIITGAASGIGLACARALTEVGRAVALWDISSDVISAAEQLQRQSGVDCIGLTVDVADIDALQRAVGDSRDALGPIGGLVHAAGIAGVGMLDQLEPELWDSVLNINLRAEVFLAKALRADMKSLPGSAIVGIASINATLGNAMNPSYSASKGGMLALNRALADDLGRDGIRINSVSPGQILTPMIQQAVDHAPGLKEEFERRILLGRIGEPEEIGRVVRFLLSNEASYITASEIVVDGGNISSQR
ncbi:NAD(P)-dependent dehydrogenase (short-subunit alcohol dehydrogenase family) [Litorivivens lipolytica]|uniref:NAD(P)-dependent dehydrogenase (Short-subunit alcohol dehydrogenase family) n=1 Tax=Litorivivens lipolytica TaxID=1524264 RepID=A0A7W4W733_9GAMM|nr:SDR family oxidoreductase [Litorivivens lipolytica]MBB3048652.1 NAD(P)-dependent dehydrogenase (short-subunit alcohol dehydrogenase family) [Litorivivens lipolytica]